MNYYLVKYDGSYLGGRAVVIAEDEDHAKRLVEVSKGTTNFDKVEVEEIRTFPTGGTVLYNWDGEY